MISVSYFIYLKYMLPIMLCCHLHVLAFLSCHPLHSLFLLIDHIWYFRNLSLYVFSEKSYWLQYLTLYSSLNMTSLKLKNRSLFLYVHTVVNSWVRPCCNTSFYFNPRNYETSINQSTTVYFGTVFGETHSPVFLGILLDFLFWTTIIHLDSLQRYLNKIKFITRWNK